MSAPVFHGLAFERADADLFFDRRIERSGQTRVTVLWWAKAERKGTRPRVRFTMWQHRRAAFRGVELPRTAPPCRPISSRGRCLEIARRIQWPNTDYLGSFGCGMRTLFLDALTI